MKRLIAVILAAAVFPTAGFAAEKVLYSFAVPSWQETVKNPGKDATVKEEGGVTHIYFHRPTIKGGINSRLEQQIWEDSTSFVISDARGKPLYCYCAGDAFPTASMRSFLSRDVYYIVDDSFGADATKRKGEIGYPYQVVEVRRGRVARYACEFKARLPLAAPRNILRQKVDPDFDELPDTIADFLSTHGADLAADKCVATSGDTK